MKMVVQNLGLPSPSNVGPCRNYLFPGGFMTKSRLSIKMMMMMTTMMI